jgi:hypothetical protein
MTLDRAAVDGSNEKCSFVPTSTASLWGVLVGKGLDFRSPAHLQGTLTMQINRKTRNITKYLKHLRPSELYMLGLVAHPGVEARPKSLGFEVPLFPGQSVLVPARKGPASQRNAEGFDIVHCNGSMETAYRQVVCTWTQFAGRNVTEEKSKVVDAPYSVFFSGATI